MTIHRMLVAGLPALFGAFLGLTPSAEAGRATKARTQITGQVNLNTATTEQLRLLPRLRPKTAEAIVAYRAKQRFQSVREVMQVKGVGQASFLRLKPHLAVEGPNTLARVKLTKSVGKAKVKVAKGTKIKKAKKAKKAKRSQARKASAEKRRAKTCTTAERRVEKCQQAGRDTAACKRAERKVRSCQLSQAKRAAGDEAPKAASKQAKRARRPKTAAQKAAACKRILRTVKTCDAEGRTNPGCVIARSKAKSCEKTAATALESLPAPRPTSTPKNRAEKPAPQAKGTRG